MLESPMPMLNLPQGRARSPVLPPLPTEVARARLRALPFPPEATIGIPYYDDEFDMAQSLAHSEMVADIGQFLRRIAPLAGLKVLSDNPVWYWIHVEDRQRILYPDYALAATSDPYRVTALDVRVALEVVSTERAEKERKDTERMRATNAANGVPEFGLLYPEPEDSRSLRWFQHDPISGDYQEITLPANQRFRSLAVPGLELEVLAAAHWEPGRKVRLWYQGRRIPTAEEEGQRADQASRRAEQASRRAKEASHRAKQESRRASEEAQRANAAEAELARLQALLDQAGVARE
jgi:hypothetical protein